MDEVNQKIDDYLTQLEPWQRNNLIRFRQLVHETVPTAKEEWKWSVPCFSLNGRLIIAMSAFQGHTKYNFLEGATLHDKYGLFNSGLDSIRHRSINLPEGRRINEDMLADLIKQAAAKAQ